jgi:hypothetical protein
LPNEWPARLMTPFEQRRFGFCFFLVKFFYR